MSTQSAPAITADGLTKRFGELTALDNITLEVPSGGVVGFVGPNGAGKSTFIRTMLGLLAPSAGTGTVLGEPIEHPERSASQVGALIENPALISALSGRQNLLSLAALRDLPTARVGEVLKTVDLIGRENDRARTYSLGMKQRLGIATALLSDPQLLILDEPTNGLDPAGIVEIRGLLRRFADEGRTVMVSSHLLSEIQAVCDSVIMIRFGHLVYSGPLDELMQQAVEHLAISPDSEDDLARLGDIYLAQGWKTERSGPGLQVDAPPSKAAFANQLAAASGIVLRELTPVQESLEDVFLRLTGPSDSGLSAAREAQGAHRTSPSGTNSDGATPQSSTPGSNYTEDAL